MVIQSSNIGMRSERYYRKREEEVKSLQLWGTSKNGQDELQMGNALKEGGVDAKEIAEALDELKARVRLFAGLDTLEYLQKGGRISKTAASIGRLAGIKPIITIDEEGKVAVCGKQRGNKNVFRQIIKYVEADMPDENYSVYFLYSADKKNCISFIQTLQKNGLDFGKIKTREIGPTIGSHIGPGAFGIVYVANK